MLQRYTGKKTVQNFNKINEQLRVSATKADTFSAFIFPSMNFINNLGMGLVIGTGSVMVLNGMTTVGVIAALLIILVNSQDHSVNSQL